MRLRSALAAMSAVGVLAFALAVPAAGLTLTPAGVADGFTLNNFLSGGSGYTFLGAANLPDGTLAVGGFAGQQIFKFNDVNGQTLANAIVTVPFSGEIDLATAGGQAYAASRSLGFFQVSNNLTLTKITPNPPATPTQGIAGNPVTGNLVATSSAGLINLNPITGNNTFIVNPPSLADGVTVSPNGSIAYVAIFGGSAVLGYDIATGALVFSASNLPGGPDGAAVIIGGALDGDIVVNNNDGTVGLLDVGTKIETIIASGGTRGDFASPDLNNGSLLLFEDDSVWRLSLAGGGIGGPGPGGGPSVPEPASLVLLGIGLAAFAVVNRRHKRV